MKTYYVIFTYVQNDKVYSHNAINVCADSAEEAKDSVKSLFVDSCEEFICNEVCEVVDNLRESDERADVRYITFVDSVNDIPDFSEHASEIDDITIFGVPVNDIPWGKTITVSSKDFKELNYYNWNAFEFPIDSSDRYPYIYPEWIIKNIKKA